MIRKLLQISAMACLLSPPAFSVTKNKPFPEYSFEKGLDTYHSPTSLPSGYVQNSLNVLFDDVAPVTKRSGYTVAWSSKGYSYTGLWTYTDASNTTWQLARSSDQITANNLSGKTVLVATVSVNNLVGETNAFGDAWFVDPSQGVYFWNGSSTSYVTGSPAGSIITTFHGRLWVTGLAVPYGNQVYGSGYFAGQTWTTGLNATDPVQYSIGMNDNFDNLTAEYVYLDTLYFFKHSSIYALYGFDQTSFQISQLTQECGCIDGATLQTWNSALEFVSLRGVEAFNGYSCKRISDPVKNKVDPAIQAGGFSQQSWVQQSQADWQAGTFTPTNSLSATIASPALVLSTFSATENSNTQWTNGSTNETTVNSNSITLSTNNSGTATNPDFESAISGNWTASGQSPSNWNRVSSYQQGACANLTPQHGSFFLDNQPLLGDSRPPVTEVFEVIDLNSNILAASQNVYISQTCGTAPIWTQYSISDSADAGKRVMFRIHEVDSLGGVTYVTTSDSYIFGGSLTFYSSTPSGLNVGFDNIQNGSSTITSGSFTSQTYNTGISSSVYSISNFSWTPNTTNPTFDLQTTSNATTGPWTEILTTSGTNAPGQQYVRYTSTLSIGALDNALTSINSASIIATASTGTFKSQIHTIGAINSWGNFSVTDALNNGNIVFSVCSSTNSNMSTPVSCAAQTPNSQIIVSTGTLTNTPYVQWYATFTVTAATQTPTLNSGTVQWFTGTKAIPMATTVWDNRYWLSLTTNTADTGNDAVMVLNKTGAWSIFDLHAGGFTQTKNNLYHSDSLASGNIYLDNQGYGDNGVAINAFINTRNESLGDLSSDDYMYALYPSAIATGNCPMTVQYSVDNSTTSYILGTLLLNEFNTLTSVRLPFPIDASHQVFGQSADFTLGTDDASCPWQLIGIEGLFKTRPIY